MAKGRSISPQLGSDSSPSCRPPRLTPHSSSQLQLPPPHICRLLPPRSSPLCFHGLPPSNSRTCTRCCRDLPEAILHPEFTRGMLTAVPGLAPPEHNLRWFNPTLIAIRGTPHIFLRGANFTLCPPGVGVHIRVNKTSPPYASQVPGSFQPPRNLCRTHPVPVTW